MICPKCGTENEDTFKFCKKCGADLKAGGISKNGIITATEEELRTVVEQRPGTVAVRQTEVPAVVVIKEGKPGALTAVAIMMLIAGIFNLLAGIGWFFSGLMIYVVGVVFTIIPAVYCSLTGVFEIVYAARLLSERPTIQTPPYFVSILGIIGIIFFSITSAILEIVNLVLMSGTEVKAYLSSNR
jgi:hypothetical protein